MGIFDKLFGKKQTLNKFNQSFFYGTKYTSNDDADLTKYVDMAYNINPTVYSVVNQISRKLISIPYGIKEIKDKKANKQLNNLIKSTNYNLTNVQRLKASKLEYKAMSEELLDMPLEKPNIMQSWDDFFSLSEIFLNLTGNIYWYMVKPENGANSGVPKEIYVLPSHLMEIVLKDNANVLKSIESPVDYYQLTTFSHFKKFNADEVVHIAVNNPNFGFNGEHLYGQSPLRAAWKNVEASNKGLDLNINTLKNGGVFGFIHGKSVPLTQPQAVEIKNRLKEMNSNTEDLSRIAGMSAELGFTRLSLTSDELKPFEYLKFNEKQICNVFGWSDALLNNDDGGKYDKQKEEIKRVLTGKIIPDSKVISRAFNDKILSLFNGYDNKTFCWDFKEVAELQANLKELSEWIGNNKDRGLMSANEGRLAMGMESISDPLMDMFTVKDDIMSLEDAITPKEGLTE